MEFCAKQKGIAYAAAWSWGERCLVPLGTESPVRSDNESHVT